MNAFAQPSAAPVAGPQLDNRRVLAAIVDLIVIFAGGFVLGLVAGVVFGGEAEWGAEMNAIGVAWALYYYFALESGAGQTLGKKLLKIRVVRADGGPVGMREVAVRTLLRVVDGLFLYLVGLIVMLATGQRRQRLGDLAAGTVVADASAPPAPQASAPPAAAPPVPSPEAVDEPDEPPVFEPPVLEPRDKTPVDVGTPLAGLTPPERPDTPELTEFEPFAAPAEETGPAEEPHLETAPFSEPIEEAQPEHPYEYDAPGEESEVHPASDEPYLPAAPADEPHVEPPPPPQEPYIANPPAEEPLSELTSEPEEPHIGAPAGREEADDDEDVTVKSVETVSAIDLVMGGVEGDRDDAADDSDADASERSDDPGDGPGSGQDQPAGA